MKYVWPKKISKIVAELLTLNARVSIVDNVTRGKLSVTLSQLPNYTDYFLGSIILGNKLSGAYLLNTHFPITDINTKTLTDKLCKISQHCVNLFYSERPQCNVIVYKLDNETESDTQTVAIYMAYNHTSHMQKFIFNKTETPEEELIDTIIDHTLEMLIELLTKIPHLKYMEL